MWGPQWLNGNPKKEARGQEDPKSARKRPHKAGMEQNSKSARKRS